jgi:hypothetical protein
MGTKGSKGLQGFIGATGLLPSTLPATGPTGPVVVLVRGNYYASNKSFIIDHPLNKNKYLVHSCLEGPEAGVYYRGTGTIDNDDSVTIVLPDYVSTLATDFTVQLTPIIDFDEFNNKFVNRLDGSSRVKYNSFTVYGSNGSFYWQLYGKRFDIDVEPNKNSVDVKGNGPYKWI